MFVRGWVLTATFVVLGAAEGAAAAVSSIPLPDSSTLGSLGLALWTVLAAKATTFSFTSRYFCSCPQSCERALISLVNRSLAESNFSGVVLTDNSERFLRPKK